MFTRKIHTDVCLHRLRAAAARRAGRGLPAIRHPQRADAGGRPRAWRARTSTPGNTSSSACTAWASRSTTRSSAPGATRRPCRVYAPVGSHETLLAYLVRRLLENGANTSFVNRIADAVGVGRRADRRPGRGGARARTRRRAASQDRAAARSLRARARRIRPASTSSNEARLAALGQALAAKRAEPTGAPAPARRRGAARSSTRPTRATSSAMSPTPTRADVDAPSRAPAKGGAGVERRSRRRERARILVDAAARFEARGAGARRADRAARRARPCPTRSATCARRSISCATTRPGSPTRLRQRDASPARNRSSASARGTSRIAIFTGQIAAALAAGNAVIAKPAEETPLDRRRSRAPDARSGRSRGRADPRARRRRGRRDARPRTPASAA